MTFKQFLKNQTRRRGSIRDFIEDAVNDKNLPDGHDIHFYLLSKQACSRAFAAYQKLRKEYLAQNGAQ